MAFENACVEQAESMRRASLEVSRQKRGNYSDFDSSTRKAFRKNIHSSWQKTAEEIYKCR